MFVVIVVHGGVRRARPGQEQNQRELLDRAEAAVLMRGGLSALPTMDRACRWLLILILILISFSSDWRTGD
jgi:hypothetical protein